MTTEESALLDHIFDELTENEGTPDSYLLDLLASMSKAGKAEFIRRMDEQYGVRSPQVH